MLRHRADNGLFRRHRLVDAISKFRRKPLFEALESRLLLSADIAPPLIADALTEPAVSPVEQAAEPQNVVIRFAPVVVTSDGALAVQGGDGPNVWRITGADQGTLNGDPFSGAGILLGGTNNEDTFIFEPGGTLSGYLDGGAGGNDSLVIDGGSFTDATFQASSRDSGTVQIDGNTIRYLGLEPIVDNSNTVNRVFTGTAGDDQIRLKQGPSGQLTIESQSGTFESITFAAPSTSLTLDAGAGDDVIVIDPLGTGFTASLSVDGGSGTDRIDARRDSGSATLSDTSLAIGAQTIALSGVEQALIGAGSLNSSGFSGPVLFSSGTPQWTEEGPGPITNAQVAGITNQPVSGAINAVVPIDDNTIYVGAANGGVWKTTDGGASWTPLTDQFPSLSISALARDASDANVLYAGTGKVSSFYSFGKPSVF